MPRVRIFWGRKAAGGATYGVTVVESGSAADAVGPILLRPIRPISDVSQGSWTPSTGSDLFAMVNEATRNDTTFIQSSVSPSNDACKIKFGTPASIPTTYVDWTVQFTVGSTYAGGTLTVNVYCGAVYIATKTVDPRPQSLTEYELRLTPAEAATVTDPADIRVELVAN